MWGCKGCVGYKCSVSPMWAEVGPIVRPLTEGRRVVRVGGNFGLVTSSTWFLYFIQYFVLYAQLACLLTPWFLVEVVAAWEPHLSLSLSFSLSLSLSLCVCVCVCVCVFP